MGHQALKQVLMALVFLTAAVAHADGVVNPASEREARARFDEATRLLHLGDYDRAIAEYKAAYDLSPAPALLFNIAQAYRAKRDSDSALRYYESFLRADPKTPERAFVEERIGELRGTPSPQLLRTAAARNVDRPQRSGLRTAGAVTAGIGGGLILVGLVFVVQAQGRIDDVAAGGDPGGLKASQTRAVVFTAVGAAAMLTGGVMFYLGSQPVRVAPAVGGGSAGVQVSGLF